MKTYIVDSFTAQPFKGNPAGVCFPEFEISEEKMLQVAQELGLSETAFIRPTSQPNIYAIRYFSPKKEIPLCGHATLASAKVLFIGTGADEIHFITIAHIDLLIKRNGEGITMQFPVYDTVAADVPSAMLAALGLTSVKTVAYSPKNKIILLEIESTEILAGLKPDFATLLKSYDGINGVLVTAPGDDNIYDYHYRYFWPWAGTNEDPVTGGVQTFLAKYWSERLNKTVMKAFQSSARTGQMDIELLDDKVLVTGIAMIIFEGQILV